MDDLNAKLDWLIERQRKQEELIAEMTPILKEVMATATSKLDALEKRGWFDFARALGGVGERILDHYTADDVRALGAAIVTILDTVRALTQPPVMAIASDAAEVLAHGDEAKPIGLLGMVRASHHADVQKGMAVMMELLRHVGRAAQAMAETHDAGDDKKARLAAVLGPRRKRALGTEPAVASAAMKAAPAPTRSAAAATRTTTAVATKTTTAAATKTTTAAATKTATATTIIDGVAFKPDGHLADPATWTRTLAENIAAVEGVPLTAERWKLVEVARTEFEEKKVAPNIRRLTQISGLSTKDIFALFPKAPGRTIARIAGTPKPAGCI